MKNIQTKWFKRGSHYSIQHMDEIVAGKMDIIVEPEGDDPADKPQLEL